MAWNFGQFNDHTLLLISSIILECAICRNMNVTTNASGVPMHSVASTTTTVREMLRNLAASISTLLRQNDINQHLGVRIHECNIFSESLVAFVSQFLCRNPLRREWLENECDVTFKLGGVKRQMFIGCNYHSPFDQVSTFPQQSLLTKGWSDACGGPNNHDGHRIVPAAAPAQSITQLKTMSGRKRKLFTQTGARQRRRTVAQVKDVLNQPLAIIKDMFADVCHDESAQLYHEMTAVVDTCVQSTVGVHDNTLQSCAEIVGNVRECLERDLRESGGKKKKRVSIRDKIVTAATGTGSLGRKKVLLHSLGLSHAHEKSIKQRIILVSSPSQTKLTNLRQQRKSAAKVMLYRWCHDNCRVNTGGRRISVYDPIKGKYVKHYMHERPGSLKELYTEQFLPSQEYRDYRTNYPGATISLTTFKRGRCACIKRATFKVCADECEIYMIEMLKAAKLLEKKVQQCNCAYHQQYKAQKQSNSDSISPLSSIYTLLSHICCERVQFMDTDTYLYRQSCCFGTCNQCNQYQHLPNNVFQCPSLWQHEINVSWFAYKKIVHENKQESTELRPVHGTAAELREALLSHLPKYMKHHWEYRWLNKVAEYDRNHLRDDEVYIQVDFSSQIRLESQHKLNSEYCGVVNQECWVVLHSPHMTTTADGIEYLTNECDHIRSITPATGLQKDQDWYVHDVTLEYLVKYYMQKLPHVRRFTIWSDQCPGQYKCRQNFGFLANIVLDRGVTIKHRFAATSQFKGVHDKVGEASKQRILSREKALDINCRCSTAYEWFSAAVRYMPAPQINYRESTNKKPTLAATSYKWIYCAANEMDACGKSTENMIVLDRSEMWDATKIRGCKSRFEFETVRNCKTEPAANLRTRAYPCPCDACRDETLQHPCFNVHIVGPWQYLTINKFPRVNTKSSSATDKE